MLKWKGKGFCPNTENVHDFFERKADNAFQGESAAQTRFSEAQVVEVVLFVLVLVAMLLVVVVVLPLLLQVLLVIVRV